MSPNYVPADGYPYYHNLAKHINFDLLFTLGATFSFLKTIDERKAAYRYAPNKWSIKQVLGHITDHERIKIHRAFLLSRKSKVELWGYDQVSLVAHSRFEALSMQHMVSDFQNVRKASASFANALSQEQLELKGTAGPYTISLKNFLRSIIGHEMHHVAILKEKYC